MSKGKIILLAVLAVLAIPLALSLLGAFNSASTAPGRVVSKTLETGNIIGNYDLFFNRKAQFDSRVSQIKAHVGTLGEANDPGEQSRLRMELAAMRQTCRETANSYNADAAKANTSLFRDRDLPVSLDATVCETKDAA